MADMRRLPALDLHTLAEVVRRATQDEATEIIDWAITPLKGGAGGFGVYRVAGAQRLRDHVHPWAVVLKTIQRQPELDDPAGWNYWQRESLLYTSGVLDDLPAGLRAARCFLVEQRPPDGAWLWLEALADPHHGRWPLTRYRPTARRLGLFNGAYLAGRALPDAPWLHGAWLRSHLAASAADVAGFRAQLEHPLVQRYWPASVASGILRLWDERELFLAASERLPWTFCHRDPFSGNLFLQPTADGEEELVAIDWALAGAGAAGEDPATLLLGGLWDFDVAPTEAGAVDQEVFAGYLDGLRAAGWAGDGRLVRLGYCAFLALRAAPGDIGSALWLVERMEEEGERVSDPVFGRTLAENLQQAAQAAAFGLQLADEARRLLESLALQP